MQQRDNFKLAESTEPRVIEWLSFTGMIIGVSILAAMNISLAKQMMRSAKQKTGGVSKLVMTFSLLTTTLFLLSSVAVSTCTVLVILSNDHRHYFTVTEIFAKSSVSLYFISQTVMIFLFIIKADITFKGSMIGYSPFVTKCLYCSSVFFVVFFFCFDLALFYERWNIFGVIASIWVIFNFVISLAICIAFIRKIELLLEISQQSAESIDEVLVFVVVKHALLVPIAICCSFICFASTLITNYLTHPGEWVPSAMFWIVVDCTISTTSIYLLFGWNDAKYKKYCSKLHVAVSNLEMLHIQNLKKDVLDSVTTTKTTTTTTTTPAISTQTTCTMTSVTTSNSNPSPPLSLIGTIQSLSNRHSNSLLGNDVLKQNKIELNQTMSNDR